MKSSVSTNRWRPVVAMVLTAMPACLHGFDRARPAYGQRIRGFDTRAAQIKQFNTDQLTVAPEKILLGGPPKDGIPALSSPKVVRLEEASYTDRDRIVVVTVDAVTRGYPISVLNWHEVINDFLGTVPVAVVYCPLCDSVTVVDRRIDDQTLEFGVSGLLYNSNVLMYDRTHHAFWSQIGFEAVSGPYAGRSLQMLPWQLIRFEEFKKQHGNAEVVSAQTGYRRDYSRNPYATYFQNDQLMFPVTRQDARLPVKSTVVGVRVGNDSRAYPVDAIRRSKGHAVTDDFKGAGRVVLTATSSGQVDVVELPRGAQVAHTFWFAWVAFHPDTTLYVAQ